MEITTNRHRYELRAGYEIPRKVWDREFARYLGEYAEDNPNTFDPRFFRYRNSWYDAFEFTTTSETPWGNAVELREKGWHGYITDSFFSGMAIKLLNGDDDGFIIVARLYFG